MLKVAALYVRTRGPYAYIPGVELWDQARDARLYPGPHPVIAHPPCERWGTYWYRDGSKAPGNDQGCFRAALQSVKRFGGGLEHPRGSLAWARFHLLKPTRGRWTYDLWSQGWVTEVDQVNYGHRALKRTWLFYVGPREPQDLLWASTNPPRLEVELMDKKERELTPIAFARALVQLVRAGHV